LFPLFKALLLKLLITATDVSGVIYVRVQIKNSVGTTVANINLYDDGAHNDGAAGDDVYGNTWTIPATLAIGNYKIFITASDTLGNVYQTGATIPFGDAGCSCCRLSRWRLRCCRR